MQTGRGPFEKADLILKHLKGELSEEERGELLRWQKSEQANQELLAALENEDQLEKDLAFLESVDRDEAWQQVSAKINPPVRKLWPQLRYFKYAAAVLLFGLLSYAGFYVTYKPESSKVALVKKEVLKNDVLPGKDKATLTLADGTLIARDEISEGTFREENGIKVSKVDGKIVYEIMKSVAGSPVAFNTIHTPAGGQYHLILPDGSKIWLNSSSSLHFPTAFSGDTRRVQLTGEGYFEIEKNKAMPFIVEAGKTKVEVLGTHFNVMAYTNETNSKTTLLEGKVKVSSGSQSKTIVPGQQAIVGENVQVRETDTDEAIAWKNGYFQFENEDLQTIMRQLKRWYDVEVENEAQLPDKHFTAVISRNTTLSQVLKMLEMSGELEFAIENKLITIKEKK